MVECISCPFCKDSKIETASESAQIPAIVRAYQTAKFTVWRCSQCGSLHSKEIVDLASYYKIYPFAKMTDNFFTQHANKNRLQQLGKFKIKKTDLILDFGCGTGGFVHYLKSQGYSFASGYDPYIAEFNNPEILKKTYDVIVSQDVIEHAEDPQSMLNQMVAMLKPDGLICFATPCADHIRLKPYQSYAVSLHQPYHRHILSKQALLQLASQAQLSEAYIFNRHGSESMVPGINILFLHEFIKYSGGFLDAGFEPIDLKIFWRHPQLLLYIFIGYFLCRHTEMVAYFRRPK